MKNKIFILTILFGFLFAGASYAALLVPEQYPTIQAAINYATDHHISGASISVKAGTYLENLVFDAFTSQTGGGIHIVSRTGPENTIIDGHGHQFAIDIRSGEENTTIIEGFTIRGSRTGVYIQDASPTIQNCIITENSRYGIKVFAFHTDQFPYCHPKIIRNKIIGNGGVSYSGGVSIDAGGPLYDPTPLIFQNNIVADNYGKTHGGLFIQGYNGVNLNLIATNNTIVENYGDYESGQAGGVQFGWYASSTIFTNNIVWDNYTVHYYEPSQIVTYDNVSYQGNPPTLNYNCIMGGWDGPGEHNIFNNPFLKSDYGLDAPSSCIDAGYFDHGLLIDWNDFYGYGLHDDQQVENTGVDANGCSHTYKDIGAIENQTDISWAPWTFNVPNPYPTIQDAINAAWNGAIIMVGPGTYGRIDLGNKKLTIKSTDGAENTIIDGSGATDVVNLEPEEKFEYVDSVLDGFTIRNGQRAILCSGDKKIIKNNIINNFPNGGIYLNGSTAEILNNTITNIATTATGAAIKLEDSAAIIKNNIITGNDSDQDGSAIYIVRPAAANFFEQEPLLTSNLIETNTISENSSGDLGGAIYMDGVVAEIKNNTISGNEAGPLGGGIYISNSSATIKNNTIANNTSYQSGGGINFANSSAEIANNTIINNSSGQRGGGIHFVDTTAEITSNVFANNTATDGGGVYCGLETDLDFINNTIAKNQATYGGGIYIENYLYLPRITNTIIWSNQATNSPSIWVEFGAHPSIRYSDIENYTYTGVEPQINIQVDPLFINPAAGDFGLGDSSPCIDHADGDVAPAKDIYDHNRYDDLNVGNAGVGAIPYVDIGAIERQTDSAAPPAVQVPGDYSSIQAAINAVPAGTTIEVSPGTYHENLSFNGNKALTLKSVVGPYLTTISAAGTVITFNDNVGHTTVLEGFTITGGTNSGIKCLDSSSPTIRNCIIKLNQNTLFNKGGGIYCDKSFPKIINTIIASNTVSLYGGGIYCKQSSPQIINSTIVNNTASIKGGGMYCEWSSNPIITNTIIWGNTSNTDPSIGVVTSYPVVTYSDIQGGYSGTGNKNSDPLFQSGSYKLGAYSPCIDAANADVALEFDLEGNPRYDDPDVANTGFGSINYVDMGALERQVRSRTIKKKPVQEVLPP